MKKFIASALMLSLVLGATEPVFAVNTINAHTPVTTSTSKEVSRKFVTVTYKTSTGFEKGRERVSVDKNATVVNQSELKNIPEGFRVVSISKINGRFVTVTVEPIPETKDVKVNYVYNNVKIGEEIVSVNSDQKKN